MSTNGGTAAIPTSPTANARQLQIIIVGCGLGALSLAIELRHSNQEVLILEKSPELSEVGAGIQLPPNASRIISEYGLLDKLYKAGMCVRRGRRILRWSDGSEIGDAAADDEKGDWSKVKFGHSSHVVHRADYQRVLVEEATRLGAEIRLGAEVVEVERCEYPPAVRLAGGEILTADVIVGGDGLHSNIRTAVLGYVKEAEESGDLAYRVTLPAEKVGGEESELVKGLSAGQNVNYWGPNSHVVVYALRNGSLINIVLCRPDDLPKDVSREPGDLEEMRRLFEHWDPALQGMLKKVDRAVKWKVWGMTELDHWTRGCVALLGDACHPCVPYAASGAALAVEDGAILGRLLGLFAKSRHSSESIPELLRLYQDLRQKRTVDVVGLANENRELYHMPDGPEQEERDRLFREHDWWDEERSCRWGFADYKVCKYAYGFDALQDAEDGWLHSRFGS